MKKLKLYLETSVWNFLFADDAPEKMHKTQELFSSLKQELFEIYISDIVIAELSDTPDINKRGLLLSSVKEYNPIELIRDEEVDALVKKYMEERIFPERFIDDARHIAVAVVNNIDIVVSWNQDHMVKVQTRFGVNGVNRLEGYKDIDIATPEEILKHDE